MRQFYSRTAVVALSAYLFLWPSSAHAQSNYRFGHTLQQLQQEQQIDQFRREQEQDQSQQLNEIPGQPATGMRQLQLNDPQLRLDQLQLEQQQNQLRQEQQLNQLREEEQRNQSQGWPMSDQFPREQQLLELQQQQQIDQLREQQESIGR